MKVRVRLFASLRGKLPDAERGRADVEVANACSLQGLLDLLEIPDVQAQMVLVNGIQAARGRSARGRLTLLEADDVAIFPPLAGG